MTSFWSSDVWGFLLLLGVLLAGFLIANILKRTIPILKHSLIPTSVLGGAILLAVSAVYEGITDKILFNTALFGGNGIAVLETLTYHTLALGFIASTFKTADRKWTKKRTTEIFNAGITTVATYLLQGIVGIAITIATAFIIKDFFAAAGIILPFGYGQGTGQALNYGNIYETQFGFEGGKSFGLTIAALGFLSASFGGVIHLNIAKKRGTLRIAAKNNSAENINQDSQTQENGENTRNSVDKMTIQIALILVSYVAAYLLMTLLGLLLPGMKSTIFGFNFLLGVLGAVLTKAILNFLKKKSIIKQEYIHKPIMGKLSNFFFDIMVVAGIAAIRLEVLKRYWIIMLILGIVGLFITYWYNKMVANKLFKDYPEEQFLAMYGMLTGTASTGIILLREIDENFETPAADNLVYQTIPAIAFGFPMLLLAAYAPKAPILTLVIMAVLFVVMNVILFRSKIFKRK